MSLKQLFVFFVLAGTLSSAGVTSAAELSVNGQIRTRGACSIALGNGGVIDLGNLSRKDFIAGYQQIYRDMPLLINCQHPTKVGIDVIDNRAGAQPSGVHVYAFGLGDPDIGYYVISGFVSDAHNADGRFVRMIRRSKGRLLGERRVVATSAWTPAIPLRGTWRGRRRSRWRSRHWGAGWGSGSTSGTISRSPTNSRSTVLPRWSCSTCNTYSSRISRLASATRPTQRSIPPPPPRISSPFQA